MDALQWTQRLLNVQPAKMVITLTGITNWGTLKLLHGPITMMPLISSAAYVRLDVPNVHQRKTSNFIN